MPTWIELNPTNRFHCNTNGSERLFVFGVQDWGLEVKDILAALVITARSSVNARVRLKVEDGASDDVNAFSSLGDAIAVITVNAALLPVTLKGTLASNQLPYLRFTLAVTSTGATEEWVEVSGFAGGRPW